MIDAQKIIDNVDILEVVEKYTGQLKKTRNGEYKTNCPFPDHRDNTPSFFVNPSKGLYSCFGCNRAGNVIQFVQEMESIDFKEALNKLCDGNEIEYCKSDYSTQNTREFMELIEELKEIETGEVFGEHLVAKYKQNQHKMFVDNFQKDTLDKFDIGFCFDTTDDLHNRITIPWRNEDGDLIAIVGRDTTGNSKAKYKAKYGSKKSKTLFNIHRAKKYNPIIVVEDEKSVMRLYEFGFNNAVALGGSELGDRKYILRKYTDTLVLALDNDLAGQKALNKIVNKTNFMFNLYQIKLPKKYKDIEEIENKEIWCSLYNNKSKI